MEKMPSLDFTAPEHRKELIGEDSRISRWRSRLNFKSGPEILQKDERKSLDSFDILKSSVSIIITPSLEPIKVEDRK